MQTTRYLIGSPSFVTLYSECNHPTEDPRETFRSAAKVFDAMKASQKERAPGTPLHSRNTTLARYLLKERYRTDGGSHKAGDRMFIVPDSEMSTEETLTYG